MTARATSPPAWRRNCDCSCIACTPKTCRPIPPSSMPWRSYGNAKRRCSARSCWSQCRDLALPNCGDASGRAQSRHAVYYRARFAVAQARGGAILRQKPDAAEQKQLWRQVARRRRGAFERFARWRCFAVSLERADHTSLPARGSAPRVAASGQPDDDSVARLSRCQPSAAGWIWRSGSNLPPAGTIWCCRRRKKSFCARSPLTRKHRLTVYQHWGFAAKGARGLGISALFAGESGTGKTMAAEVLADELHLDLYRIDLASVVSKYIGETEKNLRRVFDAAEDSGAILALRRSRRAVRQTQRSARQPRPLRQHRSELSVQRMEAYRGLAILTTNMKSALDVAFQRRLTFRRAFPVSGSATAGVDLARYLSGGHAGARHRLRKLARLSMSGGNIRNIALNAAFLAAEKPRRSAWDIYCKPRTAKRPNATGRCPTRKPGGGCEVPLARHS